MPTLWCILNLWRGKYVHWLLLAKKALLTSRGPSENDGAFQTWQHKPTVFSRSIRSIREKGWMHGCFSYVCDWHCRRRSNRWMALSRWFPVWRQATPTCHSQMSDSGRWRSTWSSANICFSISKPDETTRERAERLMTWGFIWVLWGVNKWKQVCKNVKGWSVYLELKHLSGNVLCALL